MFGKHIFLDNFSVYWTFSFPSPIVSNKLISSFKTFFLGLVSRSGIHRSKDVSILSNKLPFKRRILVSNYIYIFQKAEGHQLRDRRVLGRNQAASCNDTLGPAERLFHDSVVSNQLVRSRNIWMAIQRCEDLCSVYIVKKFKRHFQNIHQMSLVLI